MTEASLGKSNSELAPPTTKRQCTRNVAENPNSAWSNLVILCLVREDTEKEKAQLQVCMPLSLTFEMVTDGDVDVTREASVSRLNGW